MDDDLDTGSELDINHDRDSSKHVDQLKVKIINLLKVEQPRKALKLVQQALELAPERTSLHHLHGQVELALNRPDEALAAFDLVSPKAANQEVLAKDRARVLRMLKLHEQALRSAQKAIELAPEYIPGILEAAKSLEGLGDHQKALRAYEKALQLDPEHREAHYRRGLLLHKLGRNREALEEFDKVLELRPRFKEALQAKGMAHDALGEYDKAAVSLKGSIGVEDEVVYNDKGVALSRLGQNGKAVLYYQKALELNPEFGTAWFNIGKAYYRLGDPKSALAAFQRAVELKPDHKSAWNNLGVAYRRQGRYKEACHSYRKAIALDPEYAWPKHNLGVVLEQMGEPGEAREAFMAALKLKPDYLEAKAALRRLERGK